MASKTFKTRLQAEREKRNLTQEEFSVAIDAQAKTVGRWERGEQFPGKAYLRQLSTFFGQEVDASWFEVESAAGVASPLLYIPYESHPYFTDYRGHVERLRERFMTEAPGASRQAISGLGGIGKTQLALAYAYRYQSEYSAVLWVGASSQTQLFQDLATIALRLQVSEAQKAEPQQRYLVNEALDWLQAKSGWLLILDNVEEDINEQDRDNREESLNIDHLLMVLKKGHILLTTRSQTVARLVQNLLLEEMSLEEGAQLLLLRNNQLSSPGVLSTADESQREGAFDVARLLAGLPLALEQARAYIEATGCGFTGYRHLYEQYRKELLASVTTGSRLAKDYHESVTTTWLISFRHVEQQCAVASDLLKLCAYLAPDAIPEDLFLKGADKLDTSVHQLAGNMLQFNHACQLLLNYSLIKRHAERTVFSLHRLIQAVLQDRLDEEAQRLWAMQAVQAVEHAFSEAQFEHRDIDRYLPHARFCAMWMKKLALAGKEVAHLLEIAAHAVYERGWYAQARPLYLRAHAATLDLLGASDPHTLSLLLDIAQVHMDLDAAPLAALFYRSVKKGLEQRFEPADAQLITYLNRLADAEFKTGNLLEAAQVAKEAFTYNQRDHADLAQLAVTYTIAAQIAVRLQQIVNAGFYYQTALLLRRQAFGLEHPEYAKSLTDFGVFHLLFTEDLEQAEDLLQVALGIRQRILGYDHPETAESLLALAMLSWQQQNYAQAQEYYQQALAIRQQKLGPYHPGVTHILYDLAQLTAEQTKDAEAEQYFREMLAIAPHTGGTESVAYRWQMKAYADFLQNRGRSDEAAAYEKQIADLDKRLAAKGALHTLNFSHVNEEGQEIMSDQMWFFPHGE